MAGVETGGAEAASWPKPGEDFPGGPTWAELSQQTQEWVEAIQPEAMAKRLQETVEAAYWALSALATFSRAYPPNAYANALAHLPEDRAGLFGEMLDFSRSYLEGRVGGREAGEPDLQQQLYDLLMKAPPKSEQS